MEACGIAHTCHAFQIPFLIIRSVSDMVNKLNNKCSHEEFLLIASEKSTDLIIQMLKLI